MYQLKYPSERRERPLSPRVKLALRLYVMGAAKTKKEAAAMAGLQYSSLATIRRDPQVLRFMEELDAEIAAEAVNTSELLKRLGRRAIRNIAGFMESEAVKDEVRFKAAQDLADRSPETSKVLKVHSEATLTMSPEDVLRLRAAMLDGAQNKILYAEAAEGNFVKVNDESTVRSLELVKENSPSPEGESNAI